MKHSSTAPSPSDKIQESPHRVSFLRRSFLFSCWLIAWVPCDATADSSPPLFLKETRPVPSFRAISTAAQRPTPSALPFEWARPLRRRAALYESPPLQAPLRPPSFFNQGQASPFSVISQAQTTTPSFAWGGGYGTFFFIADVVWASALIGGLVSLIGNIYAAVNQKQLLGWGISGTVLSALSLLGCLFAFSLPRGINSLAFLGLGAIALISVLAPVSFSNLLRDEHLSRSKSIAHIAPTLTPWVELSPQQGVTAGVALSTPF